MYKSFYDKSKSKSNNINSLYIEMEFLLKNLKEIINLIKKSNKPINKQVLSVIIKDICQGLKEIHSKNLIHCNLEPQNIYLCEDYVFKIGNIEKCENKKNINEINISNKNKLYLPPELLRKGSKNIDSSKIDIWSLACIIYELIEFDKDNCFEYEEILNFQDGEPEKKNRIITKIESPKIQ